MMSLWRRARQVWQDARRQRRRVGAAPGRLYFELRDLDAQQLHAFAPSVESALERTEGVHWARVNAELGRIVVAHEPGCTSTGLEAVVAEVEAQHGFDTIPYPRERDFPDAEEPLLYAAIGLGAAGTSLAASLIQRVARVRRNRTEVTLAALVHAADGIPHVRKALETRLGTGGAELSVTLSKAVTQALVQGTFGSGTELAKHYLHFRERRALRDAWQRSEAELCADPAAHTFAQAPIGARPRPLPRGLVQRYGDMATMATLGGAAAGFTLRGGRMAASGIAYGGLPEPAFSGRDAFASQLAVQLAERDMLIMHPGTLRELDHITCVVLEGDLVRETYGAGTAEPLQELATHVRRNGFHLVVTDDPQAPIAVRTRLKEDERIAGGTGTVASIRTLQRRDHAVCFIGSKRREALRAADLGVGLEGRDGAPWGADLLCRHGLEDAYLVVDACIASRQVGRQSVQLAMLEAGTSGLLSIEGIRLRNIGRFMTASAVASLVSMGNGIRMARATRVKPGLHARERVPWHNLDAGDVLQRLDTTEQGLDDAQAEQRLTALGTPPSRKRVFGRMVLDELSNPFSPILVAGTGVSALTGQYTDAGLIAGVTGLNTLIGASQRYRTERALAALEQRERQRVRVVRGGRVREADRGDLVTGDVIEIGTDEVVPADCRVLHTRSLEVDESSLTGESVAVYKDAAPSFADTLAERHSMLYEGTVVTGGEARAIVVAVGEATEARRALAETAEASTGGVEARLDALTSLTAPAAALSGAALVASGLAYGRPTQEVMDAGVSLSVAAIPEGLPLLSTIAQLAAAQRLKQHDTLVRNPRAIETVGRVDVLCADKTGTLTEGRVSLHTVSNGRRQADVHELDTELRRILAVALRATPNGTNGERITRMTDRAVVEGAQQVGIHPNQELGPWTQMDALHFEPGRSYHATLGRDGGSPTVCVKGAPEIVLPRCQLDEEARAQLLDEAIAMARRGLRVLAVAERSANDTARLDDDDVDELSFCGFVGLVDPVRASARKAVDQLQRAGVQVVIITGDHPSTAQAIASELGLEGDAGPITGPELDTLDDDELDARARRTAVYARVTPRQKVRIIRALQRSGRTVAMTGDGANDAPAIRLADVGIAVGAHSRGAARDAADLIVTDERIETIIEAVLEGRGLWSSVRDAVSLLVGGNLGEIGFTLVGGLFGGRAPLNARQLLLVNLLTDSVPALAIAARPPGAKTPEDLLREGPEASLGTSLYSDVAWRALITGGATTGAWIAARTTGTRKRADSVALLALVGSQMAQTLISDGRSKLTAATSLGTLGLLVGTVQTPGISRFFGCRPLGPLGLFQASAATVAAGGASALLPAIRRKMAERAERKARTRDADAAGTHAPATSDEAAAPPRGRADDPEHASSDRHAVAAPGGPFNTPPVK